MVDVCWLVVAVSAAVLAAVAGVSSPRRFRVTLGMLQRDSARRSRMPGWLQARPDAWPARRRATASAALAAVGGWLLYGGGWWAFGLVALPVLGCVVYVGLGRLEPASAARRRRRMVLDLPQAYELLGACLGAGLPLRSATAEVAAAMGGPVGWELQQVVSRIELGAGEAESWRSLRHHPLLGRAATDLARSVETGSLLVQTLRHHAEEARRHRRAELEAAAKTVGVRSVLPLMICFLPAFFLIGIVPTVVSAMAAALQ
ncbi:hypothetical protein GCM10009841_01430 [Microlunatus panaciterrae]|uniref:Pilus assembly protein TadC n=1 Tax=Microlunatus panaciterrae TaxID=400768 RepID=A0ABS2RJP3_9ACTN|nr:type II secretion system F family protein [Microlunatus panaciterrae]MBM7799225.1 pilus assembly protein TadC [Microlunatus panaciterrae]